ncbi:Alpha/beta hydrolase family [Phytophthora infestans]|uniref:Alpha/beta hydrolase family n=1 Tax=Phytophthora infestans TaxID=4787 RepID=A0A833TGV8_PHYIN|nr:Alpha/beta hydrolase family [Phytophthora infestans]
MATLLFAHATGFCKQVWDPIIRRLKCSPLLQNAVDQYVTYDQPYHGVNRDNSVLSQVYYKNNDPNALRVRHPMNNWPEISADAAWEQVQKLQSSGTERRPLIGIGHSMGAAALWATEAKHPGTFDGLILFEPIYGEVDAEYDKKADFLVSLTLAREKKWSSIEAAVTHFENWKNFASWDREMLASWIKGAVVFDQDQQAAVLACDPLIEASVYAGSRLVLAENQLAAPRCPVTFHSGDRTKLFDRSVFDKFEATHPAIYTNHTPLPKTSHLMVFEDPAAATNAIVADLKNLSSFQTGSQPLQAHL